MVLGSLPGNAPDGNLHAAVGGLGPFEIRLVSIQHLLDPFAVNRADTAVNHQRIIHIILQGRDLILRKPVIPQGPDIHQNVVAPGMDHQQVSDPGGILDGVQRGQGIVIPAAVLL